MKILYLNPGAELGGAETALVDLLAAVREREPEWELHLLVGSEGPLLPMLRELGIATHILAMPPELATAGDSGLSQQGPWQKVRSLLGAAWGMHRYGKAMQDFARKLRPDLVHATGFKMQVIAGHYLAGSHPVLWHIHDYVRWRPIVRKLLRPLAGRVRGAVANSDSALADLQAACPDLRLARRLYNAVDVATLTAQTPHNLDEAAGVPPPPAGTLRIGLVATYARWKGHLCFLDALARLDTKVPWRAYLVGGPIYKTAGSQFSPEELDDAISERVLEGKVFRTGFLKGQGSIMQALDVVVHASTKPEPFGMVVVEAMACARPVVVSCGGGAAELFTESVTALGHQPGDAAGLAAALRRYLEDAPLREQIARAGQEHARRTFHRQALAEQLVDVYRRIA